MQNEGKNAHNHNFYLKELPDGSKIQLDNVGFRPLEVSELATDDNIPLKRDYLPDLTSEGSDYREVLSDRISEISSMSKEEKLEYLSFHLGGLIGEVEDEVVVRGFQILLTHQFSTLLKKVKSFNKYEDDFCVDLLISNLFRLKSYTPELRFPDWEKNELTEQIQEERGIFRKNVKKVLDFLIIDKLIKRYPNIQIYSNNMKIISSEILLNILIYGDEPKISFKNPILNLISKEKLDIDSPSLIRRINNKYLISEESYEIDVFLDMIQDLTDDQKILDNAELIYYLNILMNIPRKMGREWLYEKIKGELIGLLLQKDYDIQILKKIINTNIDTYPYKKVMGALPDHLQREMRLIYL